MNKQNLKFKLRWWIKEHLLFYKNKLSNETSLEYKLPSEYGDFAIHPCVRYIPQGVGGYKWWMVLSPYPKYDTKKENILLFHGEDNSDKEPPKRWIFVKEVCGTHPQGYNSDPNLYFDYRDVKTLQRYIDVYGKIEPISKTGLSAKQQRQLAVAVKRARHLALLPFVSNN